MENKITNFGFIKTAAVPPLRSWLVNQLGFPSDNLEARIGTKASHGKDARDRMYLIVLASDARNAYETGTLEPLKVK